MRFKFILFGHEIKIRPEYEVKLHITDNLKESSEVEEWKHSFPIDKIINVYTQYKGFISYVFRDYDVVLMMYKNTAILHLEAILKSFREIRNKFESKGATPDQLKSFDDKIYECYNKTINVVKNRAETLKKIKHEEYQYHVELIESLEKFKIEDYYK